MPKRGHGDLEQYEEYERTIAQAIGKRIRQRRRELGMTQQSLRERLQSERVYISRTQYSRIEVGEMVPSASEIIALSTVLNVSYAWLLVGPETDNRAER
jgi:transcriptional regulator with XRE-family HTH domain